MDRTAPCGRPAVVVLGEEGASFVWTVKERSSRNVFKIRMR